MQSSWKEKALCSDTPESHIWFSYKKEEIDRAVEICKICPVRKQCFINAWSADEFYGVSGGITEYEYLTLTWKEAKSERQSNRSRTDKLLKKILQGF
jgi:WhiB family redox-sensing transcriptional regulator